MKHIEYPKEFLEPDKVLERIGAINKRTSEMLAQYPDDEDVKGVVANMMKITMSMEHFFKSREL